mmetsp:Transcript_10951/g.17537  ORF Transcript_10951/g.17537 Transcript_10951/m.17537 type:complete len:233 (+) Transcript_10951:123-821(+)
MKEVARAESRTNTEQERRIQLLSFIRNAGTRIGLPYYTTLPLVRGRIPQIIEGRRLAWPVIFIYPESLQTDLVEAWDEHKTIYDQLAEMFPGCAGRDAWRVPWDQSGHYALDQVEVYYQSDATPPLTERVLERKLKEKWGGQDENDGPNRNYFLESIADQRRYERIREDATLQDVLRERRHVIPGLPTFFVVSKASPYSREDFLSGEWARRAISSNSGGAAPRSTDTDFDDM